MGGTESQNENLLTDFNEVRRENNGIVLVDKKSENTYFLKEFSFANKRQFEMEFKRLQGVQAQPQNENILGLVRLFSQTFNNICSNSYKIYALYEYPSITLNEQIEARRKENKYFDECELWSIVQSCANALSELRPTLSLHPRSIYIVPDGVLKVINNEMIDDEYRCIVKDNDAVYYAPEKVRDFKKNDTENGLRKQGIFSLGMTILHAALLMPVQDCYNFQSFEFYEEKLEKYIENLVNFKPLEQEEDSQDNVKAGRYSEQFIEMLAMILEPNPNKRASLMQVHGMLNKVWNTEADEQNGNGDEENHENQASSTQRKEQANMSLKESKNFDEKSRDMNSSSFLLKETSKTNNDKSQKKEPIDTQIRNPKSENRSYVTSYHQSERQSRPNLTELASRGFTKPTADCISYTQPYVPPVYAAPSPYIPSYNYDQQGFRIGGPSTLPSMSLMSSIQSYPIPSSTNMAMTSNKQNSSLYTDPKLLEMIKKDLQDINQLKKSSIMNMGSYGGVYSTGYPYTGSSSFSDIGMFSSKSSLGLGLQNPNIQQIYTVNTEANYSQHRIDAPSRADAIRSQTSLGKPESSSNFSKLKPSQESASTVPPASTTSLNASHPQTQPQPQQVPATISAPATLIDGPTNPKTQSTSTNSPVFVVEQFQDGRKFEGFLVGGIKNGQGKLTYADGAYYEGQFRDDKMEGQGTLFYGPDRPAYEGQWKEDQFHGFGTLHNQSPLQLNGNFNYNDFNLIEDFWVCYEGNFDSDNKSGEGKLILSNGEEFHGQFQNDCINGKGVFLCNDGQEISGVWQDNILVQLDA